jgi:superfamily I DNA/RNA helicase/DNA polymerase III epsilon subunit-like protein
VLAGPGAGKTFCLIERIRFLIERLSFDPARICAFTFTNKAADEIASRLQRQLGPRAAEVKRGTIHAFCAELLREFGAEVGLAPGFGIADEEYQRSVLRRLQVPERVHRAVLVKFGAHRFLGDTLDQRDASRFAAYQQFLQDRNLVDFDMLVLKAAELLEADSDTATNLRRRWDYVLVDEFQDLNPSQYAVVRGLAREHRNLFGVGDDEQSIYSWAGADPRLFRTFLNGFALPEAVALRENRRCPREVFALARKLVTINTSIFTDRTPQEADRPSEFPVVVRSFDTDDGEIAWIIRDLCRDREAHGLEWGDFALLYRKHDIGGMLETSFLNAGVPCRLASGRALAEDPVVRYVLAALRVVAHEGDPVHRDAFLEVVLPRTLFMTARARAESGKRELVQELEQNAVDLPREHTDARRIRRGLSLLRNLPALGKRHTMLKSLVEELLSVRVGQYRTPLEEHHDDISDPATHPEVVALTDKLRTAVRARRTIWIPRMGGIEIALAGMLRGVGVRRVIIGGPRPPQSEVIGPDETPSLGIALGLFKALQLARTSDLRSAFPEFTAIDIETTDRSVTGAEIVEIAAVRVRDGRVAEEFHTLVRPRVAIDPVAAAKSHGLTERELSGSPLFESMWPAFRAFCGGDVLVAHNGYQFDFPILRRMATDLPGGRDLYTYDTLPLARELHTGSCSLPNLARAFGIDAGRSHRALDDTRTLARVFLSLEQAKLARHRKTALANVLDYLAIGLALSDGGSLGVEALLLRDHVRAYALGRYSDCIDIYRIEREKAGDESMPTADALIDKLGGKQAMMRIRAERTAEQRYPVAMMRLRRLLDRAEGDTLIEQITSFLERAVLSRWDGERAERERVNLFTLHSTKGLEFSRVYVVGAEDGQLPGMHPTKEPTRNEMEEARRLLYVGMTRAKDRLVLTRAVTRQGRGTGGHRFLDEMGLVPKPSRYA